MDTISEEIQQAVQIIRIAYDGIEIAMKVGSGSIVQMKKAVDFMIALLENEKTLGKTDMRKLLLKGGDLQVFQFDEKDIKKVQRMAKKYGILYSVLPNIKKSDEKREIIFHTEAVPRVNMMIQKLKFGRIAAFDEYLNHGDEKEISKILTNLIEEIGMFVTKNQVISVDEIKENFNIDNEQAEQVIAQLEKLDVLSKQKSGQYKVLIDQEAFVKRIRKYRELAGRIRTVSASNQTNLMDITISKKLIVEENDHAIKTRIPYGGNQCLWINKEDIIEIHNGKTLLAFLDKNKNYNIYSPDDNIIEIMKGDTLYENHYDSVNIHVRERYKNAGKTVNKTANKVFSH